MMAKNKINSIKFRVKKFKFELSSSTSVGGRFSTTVESSSQFAVLQMEEGSRPQ